MSLKKALSYLFILALGGLFLMPVSGCSQPVTGGANTDTPAVKPALPLLDTIPHSNVETAYFAMG